MRRDEHGNEGGGVRTTGVGVRYGAGVTRLTAGYITGGDVSSASYQVLHPKPCHHENLRAITDCSINRISRRSILCHSSYSHTHVYIYIYIYIHIQRVNIIKMTCDSDDII